MRRWFAPVALLLAVAGACNSFDADEPSPSSTPTEAGGSATDGGVVVPESGTCAECPPVTVATFNASDVVGIGVSDTRIAWLIQGDAHGELHWCTKTDARCDGVQSYGGAASTIASAPDAIYAAISGGISGRILRLGSGAPQEIVVATSEQYQMPIALFPLPDGGLDFSTTRIGERGRRISSDEYDHADGAAEARPPRYGQRASLGAPRDGRRADVSVRVLQHRARPGFGRAFAVLRLRRRLIARDPRYDVGRKLAFLDR